MRASTENRHILDYLESVVYGKRPGARAVAVRCILLGLSCAYRGALSLYLLSFRIGLRRKQQLACPVISVGNLTVGGTGKTPTVRCICKGLLARGYRPAVLSYGYGGSLNGRLGVVSDRSSVLLGPEDAGDEPAMLAAALPGVPVLVCKDRGLSGRIAVERLGADVLVLDDGFQVWKLHRDLDIVLLRGAMPLDNGRVLPSGRLREPGSALRRAQCIIATGADGEGALEAVAAAAGRYAPDVPVFPGRFEPCGLTMLSDGSKAGAESLRGRRVFAMSGIADPSSFEATLAGAGAEVVGCERLPDHHAYLQEDARRVCHSARDAGAECIVTTEKDAVKLVGMEFTTPVAVLHADMVLEDDAAFWQLVERTILGA